MQALKCFLITTSHIKSTLYFSAIAGGASEENLGNFCDVFLKNVTQKWSPFDVTEHRGKQKLLKIRHTESFFQNQDQVLEIENKSTCFNGPRSHGVVRASICLRLCKHHRRERRKCEFFNHTYYYFSRKCDRKHGFSLVRLVMFLSKTSTCSSKCHHRSKLTFTRARD